jgi:hypothetical protein
MQALGQRADRRRANATLRSPGVCAAMLASSVALVALAVLAPAPAAAADVPTPKVVTAPAVLFGLACPSATVCEAVGENSSDQGVVVAITEGTPGPAQVVSGAGNLFSVACPSATTCEAIGSTPTSDVNLDSVVVPITNGVLGTPRVVAGVDLSAVACTTAINCEAVGDNQNHDGIMMPITDGTPGPTQPTAGNDYFSSLSCPTATTCEALGTTSAGIDVVAPITNGSMGTPVDLDGVQIGGLACVSATACVLGGAGPEVGGETNGVVMPLTNGVPGAAEVVSGTSVLGAVACSPAATCVAAGDGPLGSDDVVVPVNDGTSGNAQAVPGIQIQVVACPTATACEAIGNGYSSDGQIPVIATVSVAPATSTAVACRPASVVIGSPTSCTATVTDTAGGTPSPPAGTVDFTTNLDGSFAPAASCALVAAGAGQASCAVSYTPQESDGGVHQIHASSPASSGFTALSVTDPVTVTLPPWNLEPNPSFETGTAPWGSYEGSLARVAAANAPNGAWVAQVTAGPGAASNGYTLDDWPGTVASSTAGMTYIGSARAEGTSANAGQPLELIIRETSGAGLVGSVTSTPIDLTSNSFQQFAVGYTARLAGDQIDMYLRRPSGTIQAGDAFDADVMSLATIPPTNIEPNPSFETGASGWGSWQGTLARVAAANAPDGAWVAQVTAGPGAESNGYTLDDWPGAVSDSTAGTTYVGTAWAQATSASEGQPLELVIRESDSAGQVGSVTSTPIVLHTRDYYGDYQELSVAYTVKQAGDQIDMYLRRPPGTIQTGDAFYADDLTLIPVPSG